jgi:hypothetical protein
MAFGFVPRGFPRWQEAPPGGLREWSLEVHSARRRITQGTVPGWIVSLERRDCKHVDFIDFEGIRQKEILPLALTSNVVNLLTQCGKKANCVFVFSKFRFTIQQLTLAPIVSMVSIALSSMPGKVCRKPLENYLVYALPTDDMISLG